MFAKTKLLNDALIAYSVDKLSGGSRGDARGKAFEMYVASVMKSCGDNITEVDINAKHEDSDNTLLCEIIKACIRAGIIESNESIGCINADRNVPRKDNGAAPKTDVISKIVLKDGSVIDVPISSKQSTNARVSFGQFSVFDAFEALGTKNEEVRDAMIKHQVDGSAKNMSVAEKNCLREYFADKVEKFDRWIISGSTETNVQDLRVPKLIVHYSVDNKTSMIKDIHVYTIDEYIQKILFTKRGKRRTAGFGTGTNWTRASKSNGNNMQVKA